MCCGWVSLAASIDFALQFDMRCGVGAVLAKQRLAWSKLVWMRSLAGSWAIEIWEKLQMSEETSDGKDQPMFFVSVKFKTFWTVALGSGSIIKHHCELTSKWPFHGEPVAQLPGAEGFRGETKARWRSRPGFNHNLRWKKWFLPKDKWRQLRCYYLNQSWIFGVRIGEDWMWKLKHHHWLTYVKKKRRTEMVDAGIWLPSHPNNVDRWSIKLRASWKQIVMRFKEDLPC